MQLSHMRSSLPRLGLGLAVESRGELAASSQRTRASQAAVSWAAVRTDLDLVASREHEADLAEGSGHFGHSALIGLIARRR